MIVLSAVACGEGHVDTAQAPPFGRPDVVRWVAVGDVGKDTPERARVAAGVAKVCADRGCDAILLLGDNLYPRGMESDDDPRIEAWVGEPYARAGVPVYLVLGNHDYGAGRDREAAAREVAWAGRRDGFELPAPAWWTSAGPALVVAIDTNAALQFGTSFQTAWLRDRLAESDAPWKVVLGHHPFRSDGPHGNAGSYEGWSVLPVVSGRSLATMFDEALCGQADLYLCGHDHNRQLLEHCGTTLVVSGAGGSTTEVVDRGNAPRFATAEPGFVWMELGPDEGVVVFVGADGDEEARFPLTR